MLEESEIRARFVDFEARFGRGGVIDLYFAPGRVNLIGDHTDYNGGFMLPVAVEQGTYMMIRRSELAPARLYSENFDVDARLMPSDVTRTGDWADYVRGVFLYGREPCGEIPPFDAFYYGDLPMGAGFASSASIEVVTALGFESLGCAMTADEVVKVSLRAENDFVEIPCGVMDQYTVTHARRDYAMLVNCEKMEHRNVPFKLMDEVLVVGFTGVRRSPADQAFRTRRLECEEALDLLSKKLGPRTYLSHITVNDFERARYSLPETLERRAEHVIFENVRVEEAARCLELGDPETLGHLMNRSHQSLRDLFEVSSQELDALQEISLSQQGVWGSRMTGAGIGGCVISLVKKDALERYLRKVPGLYWQSTHYDVDQYVISPGQGARKLLEVA
jgi:galactokinase